MNTPKISIIVPVYNMDLYLEECLDSIEAQTFKDWECIVVDDGSTDRSPEICDSYAEKDQRFKVIHKSNGGLSNARNAALKIVSGDTVGFVDADDTIEPDMYEYLYNLLIENDADIAQAGYWEDYKHFRSIRKLSNGIRIIDGKDAVHELVKAKLPDYVWNKLQKRNIITREFPDGRNFEDIFVYGEWLKNINKMVIGSKPIYHYRMRKGSIIHSISARNQHDYFLSCLDRVKMIDNINNDNEFADSKILYINKSALIACKDIARFEKDKTQRESTIYEISREVSKFPLPNIKDLGLKKWFRLKQLRNNPNFFSWLMRAVHVFNIDLKHRDSNMYD